jgi:preprotein translocase subunit SecB
MSEKEILDAPIKFEGYKILSIQYGQNVESEDSDFKIGYSISDDLKSANVRIELDFDNENKMSHGKVKVIGNFLLSEGIGKEQVKQLVFQNGSAMLYPYIRTIISMITALDDSRVNVMPTLNFVEMFKDAEKKDSKNKDNE